MTDLEQKTSSLIVWTYDWVPGAERGPRGHVRDLRLRWALEEAGLDYSVRSTPFEPRTSAHLARQPFAQVPFLEDGDLTIFESGACLLHLAKKSEKLLPRDPAGEAETLQWVIAALSSIEIVSVPWWFLRISGDEHKGLTSWLRMRLDHLAAVLSEREWLAASRFTVADILMSDVLRVPKVRAFAESPAIEAYIERACTRPAFKKALSDQLDHFAAGDRQRNHTAR
jgi:glutathione S-transferase